ncbi:E3 ubiquitin-protein ligase arih1-like [Dysidea avara]|uniref:E3 ubiquitin-protein ligase arih1-like n=1 Tax=Dysidea avara TaxID=196820 RepID=UPI003333A26A
MESDEEFMNDDDEDTDFSEGEEDYLTEQMGGSYEAREKKVERSDFKYEVLSSEMISHKMFEIIDEVNTVFQLPTNMVRRLLTACRWDKEKLLERYYAGDQEALFKEAHVIDPTKKPKPKIPVVVRMNSTTKSTVSCAAAASPVQEFICDICLLAYPLKEMTGLECQHLFCAPCWDRYLKIMVMDEGKGEIISCPAPSCGIAADETFVLKYLRQPEARSKFQYLITNSFVQEHRQLKWCPSPGCQNAVLVNQVEPQSVVCKCGHSFCFKCQLDTHEPIMCEHLKLWKMKCDDDSETSNWIHVNTKECPKCHATIEKNGGCNHMICRNNSCRSEFCWVCLGPWEPHGSSWYHCNRFNENDAKAARDAQAKSRAALERYLFYCNRYINHLKSKNMEHKLYEMAEQKMQELQLLDMTWIEVQFMKKAVDVLCQCRNTLMYTYAFAYFLKKNNQSCIFEDNQGDLEMATEMLSEYMERDITNSLLHDLKIVVMDKTKYCEARRQKLLDFVYEGYDADIWEFIDA